MEKEIIQLMKELRTEFPLWLEYSGLPTYLNKKAGIGAWSLLKKLVEIDCAYNHNPASIEVSISELSFLTGIDCEKIKKILLKFRKMKILSSFIPESYEEQSLLQINIPIKTPKNPNEIKKEYSKIFIPTKDFFRYFDNSIEDSTETDPTFQTVVDLYFNTIGFKMNTFILDELKLIKGRFSLDLIQKVFKKAKFLNNPNLMWVIKELFRISEHDKKGTEKTDKEK